MTEPTRFTNILWTKPVQFNSFSGVILQPFPTPIRKILGTPLSFSVLECWTHLGEVRSVLRLKIRRGAEPNHYNKPIPSPNPARNHQPILLGRRRPPPSPFLVVFVLGLFSCSRAPRLIFYAASCFVQVLGFVYWPLIIILKWGWMVARYVKLQGWFGSLFISISSFVNGYNDGALDLGLSVSRFLLLTNKFPFILFFFLQFYKLWCNLGRRSFSFLIWGSCLSCVMIILFGLFLVIWQCFWGLPFFFFGL